MIDHEPRQTADQVADDFRTADAELMAVYFELLYSGPRLDWARPHLARHIRRSLRRLRGAYIARSQTDQTGSRSWYQSRAEELSEFLMAVVPAPFGLRGLMSATHSGVGAAGAAISIGAVLVGVPASAGLGVALVAWLGVTCYCEILKYAWIASMIGICCAIALVAAGGDKIKSVSSRGQSAAELEAFLFNRLETRAPFDTPLGAVVAVGLAASGMLTFAARQIAKLQWGRDEPSPLMFHSSATLYLAWTALALSAVVGMLAILANRSSPTDAPSRELSTPDEGQVESQQPD